MNELSESVDDKEYVCIPFNMNSDYGQAWSIRLDTSNLHAVGAPNTTDSELSKELHSRIVQIILPGSLSNKDKNSKETYGMNLSCSMSERTDVEKSGTKNCQKNICNGDIKKTLHTNQNHVRKHAADNDPNLSQNPTDRLIEKMSIGDGAELGRLAAIPLPSLIGSDEYVAKDRGAITGAHDRSYVDHCGSPESGIDCDDVGSPCLVMPTPNDILNKESCSKSCIPRTALSDGEHQLNDREEDIFRRCVSECTSYCDIPCISREKDANNPQVNTFSSKVNFSRSQLHSSDGDAVSIDSYGEALTSQLRACNTNISSGYPDLTEGDDIQIISIHSLASETSTSSTEVMEGVKKMSTVNSTLPGCQRLFIRKIRTPKCGKKRVLVLEADYSLARPLPASIMNKYTRKKRASDDGHDTIVEVKRPSKERESTKGTDLRSNTVLGESSSSVSVVVDSLQFSKENKVISENRNCVKPIDGNAHGMRTLSGHFVTLMDIPPDKATVSTLVQKDKPKIDRISQLREKLRQKEADLEQIRKNIGLLDNDILVS